MQVDESGGAPITIEAQLGAAMTLAPGTKLGRYEVRTKIGEVGMGVVYLAHLTKLTQTGSQRESFVECIASSGFWG